MNKTIELKLSDNDDKRVGELLNGFPESYSVEKLQEVVNITNPYIKEAEENNKPIVFQNQEDLETYISAVFEDRYSKIMECGFENGRKQAIEAIQQHPNLVGINQFKLDIKAAIEAKKWYSEEDMITFGNYVLAIENNNPAFFIDKGVKELIPHLELIKK
jgi:arginine deiminase